MFNNSERRNEFRGIRFSHEKGKPADSFDGVGESYERDVEQKKSDTKECLLCRSSLHDEPQ